MGQDKISVILTAYNHEAFIEESIQSILDQTYENFELIIIDDGSTDKTRSIISEFRDERIKIIFKRNEGPSVAVNVGVESAVSNWIALMSGDDISKKTRLSEQLCLANKNNLDFVFSLPELINSEGFIINDEEFKFFFTDLPSTEEQIFKKLFYEGNFLCAPSAFIRKKAFMELGGFKESSLQLQDFILWINALKKYKFKITERRLIQYRIHKNNLSGIDKGIRINFENIMAYRDFFENATWEFMKNAFGEFSFYAREDKDVFEIEKSFLYTKHANPIVRMIGAERLCNQMNDAQLRVKVEKVEDFYLKDLFELMNSLDLSERYIKS